MYTNDRLHRDSDEDFQIGHHYNVKQIEEAIQSDRWPKVECKVCGGSHPAAIQKVMDTQEGGVFEFAASECTNPPAGTKGE